MINGTDKATVSNSADTKNSALLILAKCLQAERIITCLIAKIQKGRVRAELEVL